MNNITLIIPEGTKIRGGAITRETLVKGYESVKAEGCVALGEGLFLQTFESIKDEDWFRTEMDNCVWTGCRDEDIFLMTGALSELILLRNFLRRWSMKRKDRT